MRADNGTSAGDNARAAAMSTDILGTHGASCVPRAQQDPRPESLSTGRGCEFPHLHDHRSACATHDTTNDAKLLRAREFRVPTPKKCYSKSMSHVHFAAALTVPQLEGHTRDRHTAGQAE